MTLLSSTETVLCAVLPVIGLIIGAVVGIVVYRVYQSKKLGAAKQTANKMVEDAVNEAREIRKTANREAKEELEREKSSLENRKSEERARFGPQVRRAR